MKKWKKWIALLLSCLLLWGLAACGQGGGDSSQSGSGPVAAGRYVESDITPPGTEGERLNSFLAADGTLICYTQDLTRKFESKDGGATWQESAGPAAAAALPGPVQDISLLPDGRLLAALSDETGRLSGLVKISPDGSIEPFPIAALDEAIATAQETYISVLEVLRDNRLFLNFSSGNFGGAAVVDEPEEGEDPEEGEEPTGDETPQEPQDDTSEPDGEAEGEGGGMVMSSEQTNFSGLIDLESGAVVAEYPEWYGIAATADEDTLYLLDYYGEILAKSLDDGSAKTENEGKVTVADFSFSMAMASGTDGVYVLDNKRLQKAGASAAEAETIMEAAAYSFSDPATWPHRLHMLQDGGIVLNLTDNNGTSKLYKYTWDENATIDPAKTLTVWSLYENYLVRAAISELRKQDPDITVSYEVAISEENGVTAEDAIKALNTRLLNGDGPDVLVLDGCPADNYAQRGMLADLSQLVDTGDMFKNIAAPFQSEQGTWYLPMNIKIPVLLGGAEDLAAASTLEEFVQMVQNGNDLPQISDDDDVFSGLPAEEQPVLSPMGLEEIFDLLWNSSCGSVISEEGLDTDALHEMLAALQAISDKYGLGDGEGVPSGAIGMSTGGATAMVSGSPVAYVSQRARLGAYTATDMQILQMMMQAPGSEVASFPGATGGSFIPVCMVGISADSEKTDLAAAFVNTMLGETVQGTRTGEGVPVTEAGIQKQIADIDTAMRENESDEGSDFDYESLINLAQTAQLADDVVREMVWEVAQELCAGTTDLEGAVTQLEQNLKNYLAERQ